jgi:hypothetical protein
VVSNASDGERLGALSFQQVDSTTFGSAQMDVMARGGRKEYARLTSVPPLGTNIHEFLEHSRGAEGGIDHATLPKGGLIPDIGDAD